MRGWPVVLALALAACGAAPPAIPRASARPVRVMSTNQCTDQIVLALLPPERIASVTWLSRDPARSLLVEQARAVGVNHGSAEEVVAQRPDLVIAGTFTTTALRATLRRLGYPLLEVDHANGIADIRRNTRQIAAALGEQARGEALIADMDSKLNALARDPAPDIPLVAWDASGFAAGQGTLYDALLSAAGGRNIMRDGHYRGPDVEVLLTADPFLLVQGVSDAGARDLGQDRLHHPLVQQRWRGRTVFVPHAHYLCGTPMIADAARRLREQLRAAARAAPSGESPL